MSGGAAASNLIRQVGFTLNPGIAMSSTFSQPTLGPPTPGLVVDQVEPCLAVWLDRLGFTAENQVPGDDGQLVFASLKKGDIEVMYQTRASVIADRPEAAAELTGHSTGLFITTQDLDAVERALEGAPVGQPR